MTDIEAPETAQDRREPETWGIPGHALMTTSFRIPGGKRQWHIRCSCGWHWHGDPSKTRNRALSIGIEHHLAAPLPVACPTPDKRKFKTQVKAERELHIFWRSRRSRGKAMPCRVYKCPCGYWHTTSKPARPA